LYSASDIAFKYLRYLLTASNGKGHGIHSPFVFDFVTKVLNDKSEPEVFQRIESLRGELRKDDRRVTVEDLGAGSAIDSSRERRVGDIARHAAKPPKYGRLLHRIARHYGCRRVLEIGTSLGLSTSYLASAEGVEEVVTLEGVPGIVELAEENFTKLRLGNIKVVVGRFEDTLPGVLDSQPPPDLVFFDGNHRREPTLRYFELCMRDLRETDVYVFDDIHWSREMEEAWESIRSDPRVACTIDLFFVGVVFFRSEFRHKQRFSIRY
jgi:predicted O-methyltransferase YrrM